MIENERQRQAAVDWIAYWKQSLSAGDQSWVAGENAREEVMRLAREVAAFDRRPKPAGKREEG
jgi:hypothetical protein